MLSQLYIENIAVIEKAQIDFSNGFNVFSGETGAGKSILIDSINAIMGERFPKDLIRNGKDKATVSASFCDISETLKAALEDMGYEADDEILIYRSISIDGKNVCKINGRPANVSVLKELSEYLVNIHGQHDNQAILNPTRHLDYIDAFAENEEIVSEYKTAYALYRKNQKYYDEVRYNVGDKTQRIDLLSYQVNEILQADIAVGETEELLRRREVIKNSENIIESLGRAYMALQGDDDNEGAVSLVSTVSNELDASCEYIKNISEIYSRIDEIKYELKDFADVIASEIDNVEFDPRELEIIEDRLDVIYKLKKKYGNSEEEILEYLKKAQAELDMLSTSDNDLEKLSQELKKSRELAMSLADKLSDSRKKSASFFSQKVMSEATFLNMPHMKIDVKFVQRDMTSSGIDTAEFLISANAGEELKPLTKVASGGELSRIMLAIKNVLSKHDIVDTLIFDEIDAGVSGLAAEKIGEKLREISNSKQIICVTHLAQIAAFSDTHFLIEKNVRDQRTFTQVIELDFEGRKHELARIMSGSNITDISLQNAAQMLYKNNKNGGI